MRQMLHTTRLVNSRKGIMQKRNTRIPSTFTRDNRIVFIDIRKDQIKDMHDRQKEPAYQILRSIKVLSSL